MNQVIYMQIARQHMDQLLREAEMARMADQVRKAGRAQGMFDRNFFTVLVKQASMLFPFHVGMRTISTESVTLARSECALRATLALMHKNGAISDYDERFVQQFTQTFEQELARQDEMDKGVVAAHA